MSQVVVVGGGLAGLSAAHTLLERGANVLLLDKQGSVPFPAAVSSKFDLIIVLWVETLPKQLLASTALVLRHSRSMAFPTTQRSSSTTLSDPCVSSVSYHRYELLS